MKWWPFRKRANKGPLVVPFSHGIMELPALKYHAVRALCGMLMDRHTQCRSPHPFCGLKGHQKDGDTPIQLIANAIPQNTVDGTIIALYLCKCKDGRTQSQSTDTEPATPLDYAVRLTYDEKTPGRKIVVRLLDDGTYLAQYGRIANPVEGDYSTGQLDQEDVRTLHCNPEPAHARWQYWESSVTDGQVSVPEFHCLQVNGEWWIVDVERNRARVRYHQVAALEFADNPEHNWGIHKPGGDLFYNPNDGSEWSKTLHENLPVVQ